MYQHIVALIAHLDTALKDPSSNMGFRVACLVAKQALVGLRPYC